MIIPIYYLKFRDLEIINCHSLHKFLVRLQGLSMPPASVPGPEHKTRQRPGGSLFQTAECGAHANWAELNAAGSQGASEFSF